MEKWPLLTLLGFSLLLSCSRDTDTPAFDETQFVRSSTPVYQSPIGLAADPSVLRSGDSLLMYYSAEDGIAVVYSRDNGASWLRPENANPDYIALDRRPNDWDNTLETVEVIKVGQEFKMYYSGYREFESDNPHVANYEIGLATSADGLNFERIPESLSQPILSRDISNENTLDRHAMTSPGIIYNNGVYHMIYAGWNVTNNWTGPSAGIRILGATSTDGINWEKLSNPIILPTDIAYSPDVNEASLLYSDDGWWYIVFSTDLSIGIARSRTFQGNYDVYPEAIVSPEFEWDGEVTAPDGFIENQKMRLWFHGVVVPEYWPWVIGYTESEYPLNWK